MDRNFHMNNAAYPRETNIWRRIFWRRFVGVQDAMRRKGAGFVVAAQSIRHRRELRLWEAYEVHSRVICWHDGDRSFFMEFRFVRNGFVHAVQHVKYALVTRSPKCLQVTPSEILSLAGISAKSPVMPADVASWRKHIAESSQALRREAGLAPR